MKKLNKSEMIADLRRVAQALETNELNQDVYSKYGKVSITTIGNRFGSWKAALEAAGLKLAIPARKELSDDELLTDIISVTRQLNKVPSERELAAHGKFSITPFRDRWGSFGKAKEAAYSKYGNPTVLPGKQHPKPPKSMIKNLSKSPGLADFWGFIHPKIRSITEAKFEAGFYADAVETGLKEVNKQVKLYVLNKTGKELDGTGLMTTAFSMNNPIIRLSALSSETDRNIQQGYMQIFAGTMQGIRNPKAHDNLTLTKTRTIHLLFLASLLMEKLDEAGIL